MLADRLILESAFPSVSQPGGERSDRFWDFTLANPTSDAHGKRIRFFPSAGCVVSAALWSMDKLRLTLQLVAKLSPILALAVKNFG